MLRRRLPAEVQFQVVFDAENAHRRRSSLVESENSRVANRSAERRQDTTCFVHSLLEKQRKSRKSRAKLLPGINEDTKTDKALEGTANTSTVPTNSRLLTKKQLSDMAWGVRELSKTLGSIRLKLKVKTVFLLTKAHDESLLGYTREIVDWLLSQDRETPYVVYVASNRYRDRKLGLTLSRYVENTLENNRTFDAKDIIAREVNREGRLKYWNNELAAKHPHTFDFVVTVSRISFQIRTQLIRALAWWRRYPSLCQLALPTDRPSCFVVLVGFPWVPYEV